jgi:hypothetical protein
MDHHKSMCENGIGRLLIIHWHSSSANCSHGIPYRVKSIYDKLIFDLYSYGRSSFLNLNQVGEGCGLR